MSKDPAKDAEDCAEYLSVVRATGRWDRFEVVVDDYLARHKNTLAVSSLRRLLADAYLTFAPEDSQGHHRIMGKS
jgi:hypothetical protein